MLRKVFIGSGDLDVAVFEGPVLCLPCPPSLISICESILRWTLTYLENVKLDIISGNTVIKSSLNLMSE